MKKSVFILSEKPLFLCVFPLSSLYPFCFGYISKNGFKSIVYGIRVYKYKLTV